MNEYKMEMTIPKTPKGISNSITRIRSKLSAFKWEYNISDILLFIFNPLCGIKTIPEI